jgi:hypothetical protein
MAELVIFGVPALVALLLAVIVATNGRRTVAVIAVGVALGIGYFLLAYFAAPVDYAHSQGCSDCEEFLGRWWEPKFQGYLDGIGFFGWLLGVGIGASLRQFLRDNERAGAARP